MDDHEKSKQPAEHAKGSVPFPSSVKAMMESFNVSKMFSDMRLPPMPDMEAMIASQRRNLEAFAEANRVALEGAQAVTRRQMEIMRASMEHLMESVKSQTVSEPPASRAARNAELLKQSYEKAAADMRELGDLIQKSNAEAMHKLSDRFSEALNELKTLFNKR